MPLLRGVLFVLGLVLPTLVLADDSVSHKTPNSLTISDAEHSWLNAHPSVRVGIVSLPPFAFFAQGEPQGMLVEQMRLITARLGIEAEFISLDGDSGSHLAQHEDVDLMLLTEEALPHYPGLLFSRPYTPFPRVLFTSNALPYVTGIEQMQGMQVAVKKGSDIARTLARDYPQIDILPVTDEVQAMDKLAYGLVDGYIGNLAVGAYLIQTRGYVHIKVAGPTGYPGSAVVLAASPASEPFLALFERANEALPEEQHRALNNRWLHVEHPQHVHWPYVLSVTLAALLMLLGVAYWNHRLRSEVAHRRLLEQRQSAILEQAAEAIFLVPVGTIKFAEFNQAFCDMLGYDRQQLSRLTIPDVDAFEDPAAVEAHIAIIMQTRNHRFSTCWLRKDGQLLHVDVHVRLIELNGQEMMLATAHDQTSLRQAEQRLREQNELFDTLIEATGDGVWEWRVEEDRVRITPSFFHMLGLVAPDSDWCASEELFYRHLHPDDSTQMRALLERHLPTSDELFSQLLRLRHRDGHYLVVYYRGRVVARDARQRAARVVGSVSDSTTQQQIAQALEEERQLFMAGPTVVFKWGMSDGWPVHYVSPNVHEVFGYTDTSLVAGNPMFPDLIHPEDLGDIGQEVEQALADPQCRFFEQRYRLRHANGDYRHVYDLTTVVRDGNGQPEGLNGYLLDMTAQYQLQERQQHLAEILEASPDFVASGTPDLQHIYLSAGARRMCGLPPSEPGALGFDIPPEYGRAADRVHPEWAKRKVREEGVPSALKNGIWTGETAVYGPSGEELPVLQTIVVHRNDAGEITTLSTIMRDIGDLKRLEQELRAATRRAEGANRAKSAFLANMSHELRTPLNAILGYAQLLERSEQLSPELRQLVIPIGQSGEFLLMLINDILDLAKIEAGRFELVTSAVDLGRLFESLAELFRVRAREKGIALVYSASPTLPLRVEADERRLRQVCMNLLGNAIKFTEQGEVRLTAEYLAGELRVAVVDTGIGIARTRMATLFQPFTQEGDALYRQQGTGLGLAISKGLVEQMGGQLEIDSEEGVGSQVSLRLPLAELEPYAETRESRTVHHRIRGYRRTDAVNAPFSLLIVDDDASNRDLLHYLLEPLGFDIAEARSGDEALHWLSVHRTDLVLMDLVMPGRNGLDTTQAIHAADETRELPVIAVTANAFGEDRHRCLEAGCSHHIAKPVDIDTLLGAMADVLPLEWLGGDGQVVIASAITNEEPNSGIEHLGELPPELRMALEQALLHGTHSGIEEVMVRLRQSHPGIAAALAPLIDAFDYQIIINRLRLAQQDD